MVQRRRSREKHGASAQPGPSGGFQGEWNARPVAQAGDTALAGMADVSIKTLLFSQDKSLSRSGLQNIFSDISSGQAEESRL